MTSTVAVVVPSRGRPFNVERLMREAADPLARIVWTVVVDDDDSCLTEYRGVVAREQERTAASLVRAGARGAMGSSFRRNVNRGFQFAFRDSARTSHVIMLGDDTIPRTPGWAGDLADAAGPWGMSYPDDGHQHEAKATAVCMGARLYQALGFALPDAMEHLFTDDYWTRLGERAGVLKYCPEILVEHMHPDAGKGVRDAQYGRIYGQRQWRRDGRRWQVYRAATLARDVERVRSAIIAASQR